MRMSLGQLRRIISEEVALLRESEDKKSGFLSAVKKFFAKGAGSGGNSEKSADKSSLKKISPAQVMRAIDKSGLGGETMEQMAVDFESTSDQRQQRKIVLNFVNKWVDQIIDRVEQEKSRGFSFSEEELRDIVEPWKSIWSSILKGKDPNINAATDSLMDSLAFFNRVNPEGKASNKRKKVEDDTNDRQGTRSQVRSDASGTPRHF
jgi:hypothetical protein